MNVTKDRQGTDTDTVCQRMGKLLWYSRYEKYVAKIWYALLGQDDDIAIFEYFE